MAGAATARRLQEQIVEDGVIAGTVTAVRATIQDILKDPRLRRMDCVYGPNAKPKPGKEPGKSYTLFVTTSGPVKGVQTEAEVAARVVGNDLINVYDIRRKQYRSPKVPLIRAVWVYTGRRIPNPKKPGETVAESVRIPVEIVGPRPVL